MRTDIPENAARYYDLSPENPDDIRFYQQRIPSPEASILELGCGTGRVLVPLAENCGHILGVDVSETMLALCRRKLAEKRLLRPRVEVRQGDITDLELGKAFDLIIAPFRVFQTLETDREVSGYFTTVRTHLSSGGTAILTLFRPSLDADRMRREWATDHERFRWEVPFEGGRVTLHDRRAHMDREKLVLYPELVYRRYEQDRLVDETVLKISMRCYYPEELLSLIADQEFVIVNRWGGYAGEPYGEGPELIVEFTGRV
ncbi:MAG TPA: class I SAM-dependent methyltransferase [Anaerolineales bacterium]|nr:class I SAM-dependent methyltransferase [Anaerolineales bacterium]